MFAKLATLFAGLSHYKLGLLATGLLLQGALISPFPEEVIIITLGMCWGQGRITFLEALLFNCLGLVPGNLVPVVLGKLFGTRLLTKRPFSWIASPESVQDAALRFKDRWDWIIFVARFTPFIRGPVYFASGIAGMTVFRFIAVDTIAAVLQVSAIQLAGKKLGENSDSMLIAYQRIGMLMAVLLIGGAVFGYVRSRRAIPHAPRT